MAQALAEQPGDGPGEASLVRMLDRPRNTPAKLRPRLERWLAKYAEAP